MYAQLNTKTVYSFLSSTVKLQDYLTAAKHLGYQAVGISDIDNLHAAHQFIRLANQLSIKPIVGFEATIMIDTLPIQLSFIAKSTKGLSNIYQISSKCNFGFQHFSDIASHLSDIALVVPVEYAVETVLSELPDRNVYIGINKDIPQVFNRPKLPFAAVNYIVPEDAQVLTILQHIKNGTKFDDQLTVTHTAYLKSEKEASAAFDQESLGNLAHLISEINYDQVSEPVALPVFNKEMAASDALRLTAEKFLSEQNKLTPPYQERLNHELSTIHTMGFDDYFLIVADVIRYARHEQIYTGMGRGSALGSLVAYALQITGVDPVANNLLFERFLNPERASLPDIDIDMPDTKRADILSYVKNRYGSRHVAQIMTFSTFGMKQSFRDVAKVFGMTEVEVSHVAGMIGRSENLTQEYDTNNRFRAEIMNDVRLQTIFDYAKKIEGMPRQKSVHASGVVLSSEDLTNYLPLAPGETLSITQFEAHDVEDIGLIKFDFLSIKNLTYINDMCDLVMERYQNKIKISDIDLNDDQTLSLFRDGKTLGIFQFENPQMMNFLRQLKPTEFADVVAATSIFRPGPSAFIPEFIKRRHGEEIVSYPDESIADILKPTYGIMIFQEQIMQVAQVFAGFSLGRADLLRRAISKKKGEEFEQLKTAFISGSIANGHSETKAVEIYDLIERFANYGFNRSHAFGYGALAVQMAYFKAHYPDVFYEVMLKDSKRLALLSDAKNLGFNLASISINRMPYYDKLANSEINIGMRAIKGFPRELSLWILEHRPFLSLQNFIQKLPVQYQKPSVIQPLLLIGAFDEFDQNRRKLVENLAKLIEFNSVFQTDLFDTQTNLTFAYTDYEDYSHAEKYQFEFDLMGISITEHPLMRIAKKRQGNFIDIKALTVGRKATILVQLTQLKMHRTKTGATMAFLTVSDTNDVLDVTMFPETYHHYLSDLSVNEFYLITGKIAERNDRLQLIAESLVTVEETDTKLWLAIADTTKNLKIAQILKDFPGNLPVVLYNEATKTTQMTGIYAADSELLLKRLSGYVTKAVIR